MKNLAPIFYSLPPPPAAVPGILRKKFREAGSNHSSFPSTREVGQAKGCWDWIPCPI